MTTDRQLTLSTEQGRILQGALVVMEDLCADFFADPYPDLLFDPLRKPQFADFADVLEHQLPDRDTGQLRMPIDERQYALLTQTITTVLDMGTSRSHPISVADADYTPSDHELSVLDSILDEDTVSLDPQQLGNADATRPEIATGHLPTVNHLLVTSVPPQRVPADTLSKRVSALREPIGSPAGTPQAGRLRQYVDDTASLVSDAPVVFEHAQSPDYDLYGSDGRYLDTLQFRINEIFDTLHRRDDVDDAHSLVDTHRILTSVGRFAELYTDPRQSVQLVSSRANDLITVLGWLQFRFRHQYVTQTL